jgi:polysaccharide biosynthesis protein PslJ
VSTPDLVVAPAGAPGTGHSAKRAERWLWIVVIGGMLVVLATAAHDGKATALLVALVAGLIVAAYQRVLLAWQTMLGVILLVIVFVPIRRYTVGANLPIELEPYRIVIGLVLACWFCALAADPKVRLRKTGLEAPLGALLLAILLSLAVNPGRLNAAGSLVLKNVTFFVSYVLLVYFVASVIRSRRDLDRMLRLLVGGGTIIAIAALFEWRTTNNLFNWYGHVMPFLHYVDEGVAQARGAGVRARASAQHPIALSAALVMLVPLAFYLYKRDRRIVWLGAGGLMTLGALSTGSRTGTTMLIALGVAFFLIKPRETIRMAPQLIPLLIVIQVVMPGTLGTMKSMLNPSYVIKEQSYDQGATAGRVADLGPALDRWSQKPLLGTGFGATTPNGNASKDSDQQILDDQWLGSLLETGLVGVAALLWLYIAAIRRLARRARSAARADDGWLATALAAAVAAFAVGMLTFDAFAFIQVTFFLFIILAFAGIVLQAREVRTGPADQRASAAV